MKRGIFIVGVCCASAALSWIAWRTAQARVVVRLQVAENARRGRELEAELIAAQARATAIAAQRAQLTAKIQATATSISPTETAPPRPAKRDKPGAPTLAEAIKQWQEDQKRPETQLRFLAERRGRLPETYGPFYRQLRLMPTEVRAFEDIRMHKEEAEADLLAVAQSQGLSLGDKSVGKLWNDIQADVERQQRELLGEGGLQELKNYERSAGVRDLARNFAALTAVFGEPISPKQIEQLIPQLANASPEYRKGRFALASSLDWTTALAAAAGVLTARQFELVSTLDADGGGLFHARWNAELVKATRSPGKPEPSKR